MGNRDARGREKRKPKKKETGPTKTQTKQVADAGKVNTPAVTKCSHNNFVENRRDDDFKYGFCMDCRAALKKSVNTAGEETGEFLPF
jgi:hypothetical protein